MRKAAFTLLGAAAGVALTLIAAQPRPFLNGADAKPPATAAHYRLLGLFGGAFEQVRKLYVEKPDEGKLIETAIDGMLSNLEDSYYLDAKTASQLAACTGPGCASKFGNPGFEVTMKGGFATVITPIDDMPAAKAGLMAGDIIKRLDDEPVDGLTYYQVFTKLIGDVGTTARLTIMHPGRTKPIEISIVRARSPMRSVHSRTETGDIGYLRITTFNESTPDQLRKAIDSVTAAIAPDKLKGYVVDLRNNPGGLLEEAVAAADAFLESGEIVSIHGRKANAIEHFRAKPGDLANGKPMIVLINGGSASTAEVVAGALQDNHRATVVGTRSFGEGGVRTLIPLGPGKGALRLATGHYFTPSGSLIEGNGIRPNVEVQQDVPDNLKPSAGANLKDQPDLQSYIPPDLIADKALDVAYALLRRMAARAP